MHGRKHRSEVERRGMHAEQRCAEIHGEHLYKNAQDRSRQTLVSQPKSSMVISRKSSGHSSALPGCHCFSPSPQAAGPTASCSSRTHGHSLTLWTRAGISRANQYYASYPAGTELLIDTAKLYETALVISTVTKANMLWWGRKEQSSSGKVGTSFSRFGIKQIFGLFFFFSFKNLLYMSA
ncbi:hypothetical protein PVAP13_6KG148836 [Panicum virgatum]|uniref:Uncharacterized protein n=1 Tax=Panicum virgatum TaxID=38727 RepID=A0A8T0RE99_PANVG|nr:hypothetical protein PVAP13_6KG148836 [Panicum virgatum]